MQNPSHVALQPALGHHLCCLPKPPAQPNTVCPVLASLCETSLVIVPCRWVRAILCQAPTCPSTLTNTAVVYISDIPLFVVFNSLRTGLEFCWDLTKLPHTRHTQMWWHCRQVTFSNPQGDSWWLWPPQGQRARMIRDWLKWPKSFRKNP